MRKSWRVEYRYNFPRNFPFVYLSCWYILPSQVVVFNIKPLKIIKKEYVFTYHVFEEMCSGGFTCGGLLVSLYGWVGFNSHFQEHHKQLISLHICTSMHITALQSHRIYIQIHEQVCLRVKSVKFVFSCKRKIIKGEVRSDRGDN